MHDARTTLDRIRVESSRAWKALLFNGSFMDRMPDIGIVDAAAVDALGRRRRRPPARPASARTSARRVPGSRTTASSPRLCGARSATSRRDSSSARSSCSRASTCSTVLLVDRVPPATAVSHGVEQAIGIGRVESPRGATVVHRRAQRRHGGPRPLADRLVRELAGRRIRGDEQPAARLPTHQQELRALLRLRRPLMLTLLRDLRIAPPPDRPTRRRSRRGSLALRHVDCGSCNGCEHELTIVSGPTVDLARFGLGIVASPRHADVLLVTGPVTTRMRVGASHRLRRDAGAAAGRRARGLRARRRRARITRARSSVRSRQCFPSTSGFPAARRRRPRSRAHC